MVARKRLTRRLRGEQGQRAMRSRVAGKALDQAVQELFGLGQATEPLQFLRPTDVVAGGALGSRWRMLIHGVEV